MQAYQSISKQAWCISCHQPRNVAADVVLRLLWEYAAYVCQEERAHASWSYPMHRARLPVPTRTNSNNEFCEAQQIRLRNTA